MPTINVKLAPSVLTGQIRAIPSKSEAHRLLICAALADGDTVLEMGRTSEDIEATAACLRSLGASIDTTDQGVRVSPAARFKTGALLDCGESGSTFRFLLPVSAALMDSVSFTGRGRLPDRPISDLMDALKAHGVSFSSDRLPFTTSGRLTPGSFELPGNVSSQYITGLLLALPMLKSSSEIRLTTPLESASYVNITLRAMSTFGINVHGQWAVSGGQSYRSPGHLKVGGDWSNSAFFLCAGALKGSVTVTGLDLDSAQGDRAITDILRRFGANVTATSSGVTVSPGELHGIDMDVADIPDLLPVLSVTAAFAKGDTRFFNAQRLTLKESDRIASTTHMLEALGGKAHWDGNVFTVHGSGLSGGHVDGSGDHRIVMSAAIAALGSSGSVTISGSEAVNKSYPSFFEDYNMLGGQANVI